MAGRSIAFDAASTSGYEPAVSTYSWTHTVANNPNRVLVVFIGIFATGTVTAVSYAGQALTFVRADVSGVYRSEAWILFNPPIGSNTIQVDLSASLTSIANAQSYYYVNQGAVDAHNGANGVGGTVQASVTTVRDKDLVIGGLATQTAAGVTSDADQTARTNNNGALGTSASDDKGDISPAGNATLTWSGIGGLDAWAISLLALSPAVVGPSWSIPTTQVSGSSSVRTVSSGSRPGRI